MIELWNIGDEYLTSFPRDSLACHKLSSSEQVASQVGLTKRRPLLRLYNMECLLAVHAPSV